jgi:hypothetical protein
LKIDIEGCEWRALVTMLTDGSLTHVKQLLIELHGRPLNNEEAAENRNDVLRRLKAAGFRLWRDDWNLKTINDHGEPLGLQSRAHEQYFLNTNYLKPGWANQGI